MAAEVHIAAARMANATPEDWRRFYRSTEQPIYTNCRGYASIKGENVSIDGRDGWPWQAWSGDLISYGSTENHAIRNLRARISEHSPSTDPDNSGGAWYADMFPRREDDDEETS